MTTDDSADRAPASARSRRRRFFGLLALLALAAMLLWATRPEHVAGLVLDRLGAALGLEITARGVSEYHLGGAPRLVVRELVAREPGADTPLLQAARVELSLPWSTIRSFGAGKSQAGSAAEGSPGEGAAGTDLVVHRIEIDAPVIDLAALQHWRDARPPGPPVRIPTLTDGLRIDRGEVLGDGWSFEAIALDLPALHPDRVSPRQPLRAHLRGRFRNGETRIPFDLRVALAGLSTGAGLGVSGSAAVHTGNWRMPMRLLLAGRLHDGTDGLGLDGFRYGAQARWFDADDAGEDALALALVFGVAGPLRYADGRFTIEPLGAVLRGEGLVPTLDARGALAWQGALDLHLRGRMAGWPPPWPALPSPLDESDLPLPFVLDYAGPPDLSGRTALQLRRGPTRFDARFQLPRILDWFDQLDAGTPLPPLQGELSTPRLEIAGATLEGIEIEFDNPEASDE